MNTSPLRQPAKHASHPQRLPYHKKEHSQTTIDLYLKPIAKVAPGQRDIRNYFTPVAKSKSSPDGEPTKSSSLTKIQPTPRPKKHDSNTTTEAQSSATSPHTKKSTVTSTKSVPETAARPVKPAPVIPRNHKYANSAVLPKFDPFFDNNSDDFPHSVSPMAHRVTDVYARHSLVPKPLDIRIPSFPSPSPAGPELVSKVSPSDETSTTPSPSSVDTASSSLDNDEERQHGAQSFKRTYMGVHSRHHSTNESPGSPLVALREQSRGPLGEIRRPAALRAKTVPQMEGRRYDDSVIYFLPKISPTEESEVEDVAVGGRGTRGVRYEERVRGRGGGRFEKVGGLLMEKKKREAVGQKDMGVSPGLQRYYDYLASQRNAVSTKDRTKDRETFIGSKEEEETPLLGRNDSGSSGKKEKKDKKTKKKKGKGFLGLIEAYSRHVEGLQMIQ